MNYKEEHKQIETSIDYIQDVKKLCDMLMQTPHYKKMGAEGIFAIVQKAQSLGINPLDALNGGMYFVNGKVEMQAIMMAKLIRSQGHSITKGSDSDATKCVLHGKRKDNGDTWKVTFSIEDAKKAGLYRENSPWTRYTDDMLYNRALSRLARQLFPDVIGNCYVEGEIAMLDDATTQFDNEYHQSESQDQLEVKNVDLPNETDGINEYDAKKLDDLIGDDNDFREKTLRWLHQRFGVDSLQDMPKVMYEKVYKRALENFECKNISHEQAMCEGV